MQVDCVFIAAGGSGNRAYDQTNGMGKQFLFVNGNPLLYYVIKYALSLDVSRVVVAIGKFSFSDPKVLASLNGIKDSRLILRQDPGVGIDDLPKFLEADLTYPFLYLFGHSPQSEDYLFNFVSLSNPERSICMSCYKSTTQLNPKVGKLVGGKIINFKRESKSYILKPDEYFLSAPYIFFSVNNPYADSDNSNMKNVSLRGLVNFSHPEFNESNEVHELSKEVGLLARRVKCTPPK